MSDDEVTKQKYEYTQLASIDAKSTDNKKINFYGVVIDSTFPYYLDSNGKHLCILKIIDSTLNPSADQSKFIKLSIFAKDINTLPRIHTAGAIIRIHRAFSKLYNQTLQINCELPRSSWALFKGETDSSVVSQYTPVANSGKTFTLEEVDKKNIDSLREFSHKLFSEKLIVNERCILLKDSKTQPKDFDAICQVISFKQKDSDYILKVCDHTSVLKAHLKEGQAKSLSLVYGDIAKLRGFSSKDEQNIISDKFSNILVLPTSSKAKAEFSGYMKTPISEVNISLLTHSFLESPITVAKIIEPKFAGMQYSALSLSNLLKSQKMMKVKASIIDIEPSNASEWVVKYNKKTKEIEKITSATLLKQDDVLCYRVQLILKDEDSNDDNLYRVVLFTGDDVGKELLPPVVNLCKGDNVQVLKKLNKLKKLLMSFNVVCELGLSSMDCGGQLMWLVAGTQIFV